MKKIIFLCLILMSPQAQARWTDSCQELARYADMTVDDQCFFYKDKRSCKSSMIDSRNQLVRWCNTHIKSCKNRREYDFKTKGFSAPGLINWNLRMNSSTDRSEWTAKCG